MRTPDIMHGALRDEHGPCFRCNLCPPLVMDAKAHGEGRTWLLTDADRFQATARCIPSFLNRFFRNRDRLFRWLTWSTDSPFADQGLLSIERACLPLSQHFILCSVDVLTLLTAVCCYMSREVMGKPNDGGKMKCRNSRLFRLVGSDGFGR
jgi:hypothetical protein